MQRINSQMNMVKSRVRSLEDVDVRIPFGGLLFVYVILGLTIWGFSRSLWQAGLTIGVAVMCDLLANRYIRKRPWEFPWSGFISGLGLTLLLNYGAHPWLPVLPAFLAIASKYIFQVNGRHVYNPGLFGLIVGMVLADGMLSPAPAYQWDGGKLLCLLLAGMALFVFAKRIKRNALILSFCVFYGLQILLRTWAMRHHLPMEAIVLGSISSPAFYLFLFYMLTDPATTPSGWKKQVALAFSVVVVDLVFHMMRSYSTLFPALFVVQSCCLLWGWIRTVRSFPKLQHFLPKIAVCGAVVWLSISLSSDTKVEASFSLVEEKFPAMESEMSQVLEEVDPRIKHLAKWILSVGDAVAVADFDNDGDQDIFLTYPLKQESDRLLFLRNTGNGFERMMVDSMDYLRKDVAKHGLGSCPVFADYDNDGDQDLFLGVGYGESKLFRNDLSTGGSFVDVTQESGISGHTICLAATFFDYDLDGDLDLLVANAMTPLLNDYSPARLLNPFQLPESEYEGDRRMFHFMHDSWHKANNGGINHFYENEGDGSFVKLDAAEIGMKEMHWTLALVSADFNHDGYPDLYAASDFGPDDVYLNNGGKNFTRLEGKMFGSIGKDTYKGMNASVADFDHNESPDVYVSNVHAPLQAEGSLLWMTRMDGGSVEFDNEAVKRGALNEKRFGWGAAAGDLDLDGWIDIVQANGMVDDRIDKKFAEPRSYWYTNGRLMRTGPEVHSYADQWGDIRGYSIFGHQQNRVYLNREGSFVDAATSVGVTKKGNSRGVAMADFDNDGDLDVLFTHQFESASFYKNEQASPKSWVRLRLRGDGVKVTKDAVGSKVEVFYGDKKQVVWQQNTTGFSGQGDRRLLIGFGDYSGTVRVKVTWLDGKVEEWDELTTGKEHELHYGSLIRP